MIADINIPPKVGWHDLYSHLLPFIHTIYPTSRHHTKVWTLHLVGLLIIDNKGTCNVFFERVGWRLTVAMRVTGSCWGCPLGTCQVVLGWFLRSLARRCTKSKTWDPEVGLGTWDLGLTWDL
jgi:hypothetical protein